MTADFSPLNDFETRLSRAQRGEIAVSEMLASLFSAELAVPSASEVQPDWSGFQPLLFSKNGTPMLGCFSAKERALHHAEMAPFCLQMKGKDLLRRIPAGHGIVINPGQHVGFDVSPEGIAQIVADFAIR